MRLIQSSQYCVSLAAKKYDATYWCRNVYYIGVSPHHPPPVSLACTYRCDITASSTDRRRRRRRRRGDGGGGGGGGGNDDDDDDADDDGDDDYACRGGGGDVAYCEGDQRDLLRAVGPSGQLMLEPHGLFVGVSSV